MKSGTEATNTTIPLFTVYMTPDVDAPLLEVLHSGFVGQGPKVEEFEQALGQWIGNRNLLTLNSATSALHLALRLANVGYGDEVITTAMTCTATNMPILANGGKIVWADINPITGLIDPVDIERKITPRTKAIIVVDWGGTPVDLDAIMAIGRKYGVKVIEDGAHAFGASYKGRKVGTIADFTVFSFQAIKHITTVDGGALFCNNTDDYRRGKLLRWYGIDRDGDRKDFRCEEDIKEWGYKFHMNDVNATIGLAQLPHAQEVIDKHIANANYYYSKITSWYRHIAFETHPDGFGNGYDNQSAFWLYTMLLPTMELRMMFMGYMKQQGITTSQVHARNDTHTTFLPFMSNLPGEDQFVARQVSIPVHWKLTPEQRDRIVKACNEFARLHS